MPTLPSGGSGPSRHAKHAKQAPGSGTGTQQGPRQAYLHCYIVVDTVHSNMCQWQDVAGAQTSMPASPCRSAGTWQARKQACS